MSERRSEIPIGYRFEQAWRLLSRTFLIAFVLYFLRASETEVAQDCPPTQPISDDFIYLEDGDFYYQGQEFVAVGPNIYWLALAHHGGRRYPTHPEVDEALDTALVMGATAVRSHALISAGCEKCIEPELGVFDEAAFQAADYAIAAAGERGLRLILPLTDNWSHYQGGRMDFVEWAGEDDKNDFFEDDAVIQLFEAYIRQVLNRVNVYTGIAYKDDPTIMAWQIGNELGHFENHISLTDFTLRIGNLLKSLDPNHLVIDGRSTSPYALSMNELDVVRSCAVDALSIHGYPPSIPWIQYHVALADSFDKAILLDEFGFGKDADDDPLIQFNPYPPATPEEFFAVAPDLGLDGILYWSLYTRDPNGRFYYHTDGFTQLFPFQLTRELRRMAFEARGLDIPQITLEASPELAFEISGDGIIFRWQGVIGAQSYILEWSQDSLTWQPILTGLTDFDNTAFLPTPDAGAYRIVPFTPNEVAGPPSQPVFIESS